MPLHKVEDLFSGDPIMIAGLVLLLLKRWTKNYKSNPNDPLVHKTLGIIKRHNLTRETQSPALSQLMAATDGIEYRKQLDPQVNDSFGPINPKALKMAPSVTLSFITQESDIPQLERLKGARMVGMDSEWRPGVRPF